MPKIKKEKIRFSKEKRMLSLVLNNCAKLIPQEKKELRKLSKKHRRGYRHMKSS